MTRLRFCAGLWLATATPLALAQPACADTPPPATPQFGEAVKLADNFTFKPLVDARLRWEDVEQPVKHLGADAVTMRLRAGFELTDTAAHLSFLAEGEGNLGIDDHYNAFNYKNTASSQYLPAYAVVADPQNVALNRLQLQYKTTAVDLTVGRQRIVLDDERWVGASNWRQNQTTFDAVRGQLTLAPVTLDVTYSDRQRTVYGTDGGPRVSYAGRFWFLGASIRTGPITTKAFAYLVNYDNDAATMQTVRGQTNSTQTYGVRSAGSFGLAKGVKLALAGSYAQQSNYGTNLRHYSARYIAGQGDLALHDLTLTGGYDLLGADANATGGAWSVQTPMATLHKFDGWADQFLTTPAKGLADVYAGAVYKFTGIKAIPGLFAQAAYHQFNSDIGTINYGHEWDGAIGLKTGRITWLAKYADYIARGGGTTDTRKFWLQTEFGF